MTTTANENNDTLLQVTGLKTHFEISTGFMRKKRIVRAVDGVDLSIKRGRTLGLVGESGSGKTTVGRTILRLIKPTAGEVIFDGQKVFSLPNSQMRRLRSKMQIIFQDPVGSLDPRMTVGDIISEPLKVHTSMGKWARLKKVAELLSMVGLPPIVSARYPHEFSGGQRQRIGIARALAMEPDFIVCDEPVSALDVSIQAQVLNLLNDLQDRLGLTYLFIAHNLAVVEHFADDVAVMYLGKIVEQAPRDVLYAQPKHPYTESLLASVPRPEPGRKLGQRALPGEMPSPANPPSGCPFHPRCPFTRQVAHDLPSNETGTILSEGRQVRIVGRCMKEQPKLTAVADNCEHVHACLLRQD